MPPAMTLPPVTVRLSLNSHTELALYMYGGNELQGLSKTRIYLIKFPF